MKSSIAKIVLIIAAGGGLYIAPASAQSTQPEPLCFGQKVKVKRIISANRFVVTYAGRREVVRVAGVHNDPNDAAAEEAVREYVKPTPNRWNRNLRIELSIYGRSSAGEVIADAWQMGDLPSTPLAVTLLIQGIGEQVSIEEQLR